MITSANLHVWCITGCLKNVCASIANSKSFVDLNSDSSSSLISESNKFLIRSGTLDITHVFCLWANCCSHYWMSSFSFCHSSSSRESEGSSKNVSRGSGCRFTFGSRWSCSSFACRTSTSIQFDVGGIISPSVLKVIFDFS